MEFYVQTNVHRLGDERYYRSIKIQLDVPSNETTTLIKYANKGFDIIFREGYQYMKCGVTANNLVPEDCVQKSLFAEEDGDKRASLMNVLDSINLIGAGMVKIAAQGIDKKHKPKAEYLSDKFTTQLSQVIKIRS